MKAYKRKRIRNLNQGVSEENEIRSFIIITIVIVLIAGLVYGVTELTNKKDDKKEDTETKINYDVLSVGTIFNSVYDNYYVLIYNSDDENASLYKSIFDEYKEKKAKKIYYIDLKNKLNGAYYNINNDGKSNPKASKISEFNFGNLTLIEIKNKKIVNYIENSEKIIKTLS